MAKADKVNLALFIAAQIMAFGFITVLQLFPLRWFIVFLILMHTGIALLIISKRRFLNNQRPIKKTYRLTTRLMALYLPIVAYKLPSAVFAYTVNDDILVPITLSVTAVVIVVSLVNTLLLIRQLKLS